MQICLFLRKSGWQVNRQQRSTEDYRTEKGVLSPSRREQQSILQSFERSCPGSQYVVYLSWWSLLSVFETRDGKHVGDKPAENVVEARTQDTMHKIQTTADGSQDAGSVIGYLGVSCKDWEGIPHSA